MSYALEYGTGHAAHRAQIATGARPALVLVEVDVSLSTVPSTASPFSGSPELWSMTVDGAVMDRNESSPELPTAR